VRVVVRRFIDSDRNYDYYSRTFMGARRFEKNGLMEKTQ
jgi:hypothetical protein